MTEVGSGVGREQRVTDITDPSHSFPWPRWHRFRKTLIAVNVAAVPAMDLAHHDREIGIARGAVVHVIVILPAHLGVSMPQLLQ